MIKWIKGIFPAVISNSEFMISKDFAAQTFYFFIFIRSQYKNDEGLLQHELVHIWQFYRTFGLHGWIYKLSEKYRLKSEVEAYKKQLEYNPEFIDYYAERIASLYNVKISRKEALMLLKG